MGAIRSKNQIENSRAVFNINLVVARLADYFRHYFSLAGRPKYFFFSR
jgi:hypothetical protein